MLVGFADVVWVGVVVAGVVVVVVGAPDLLAGLVAVGDAPFVVVEGPALLGVAVIGVVVVSAGGGGPPWVAWSVCACSSRRMLLPVISRITEW